MFRKQRKTLRYIQVRVEMATTDRRDGYTSYTAYPMSKPLECYNYLQPASEWKEEDGALVLLVRIPSRFRLSGSCVFFLDSIL